MTIETIDTVELTNVTGGEQASLDSIQASLDRIANQVAPRPPSGSGAFHLERHYGRMKRHR